MTLKPALEKVQWLVLRAFGRHMLGERKVW